MSRSIIWPIMVLLGWTETKLWTLRYDSKSIQTSLILRQHPPKPYKNWKISSCNYYLKDTEMKITMFAHFKENHGNHKKFKEFIWFLGDTVSKLETFEWILVSIHPKSIILGKITNLNMIFHVVVSVYRFVKNWNSPQFPAEFQNSL